VEQSPAVSTANVTSSAVGAGAAATSAAEKAGTSSAPPAGGEQDDLYMADLQPTLDPQAGEAGGANIYDALGFYLTLIVGQSCCQWSNHGQLGSSP
jgi:hypothetical protein